MKNRSPVITVINTTEVRENYQNITIIGNKPGKIYYTRNETIPTNSNKLYILEINAYIPFNTSKNNTNRE